MKTKLVDGRIPAYTTCPFKDQCEMSHNCYHLGKKHDRPFSCAAARAFDMISKKNMVYIVEEVVEYEGSSVLGVFSSEKAAEDYLKKNPVSPYTSSRITSWTINKGNSNE